MSVGRQRLSAECLCRFQSKVGEGIMLRIYVVSIASHRVVLATFALVCVAQAPSSGMLVVHAEAIAVSGPCPTGESHGGWCKPLVVRSLGINARRLR